MPFTGSRTRTAYITVRVSVWQLPERRTTLHDSGSEFLVHTTLLIISAVCVIRDYVLRLANKLHSLAELPPSSRWPALALCLSETPRSLDLRHLTAGLSQIKLDSEGVVHEPYYANTTCASAEFKKSRAATAL
ncbi:hypothetical protein K440DRAFT_686298 [Wilcoxina mikolae CBS 423.85]|nr:hypothetical protein K440DRAFT_686298 [Wilcoxina mikolae CBS 423.85]